MEVFQQSNDGLRKMIFGGDCVRYWASKYTISLFEVVVELCNRCFLSMLVRGAINFERGTLQIFREDL